MEFQPNVAANEPSCVSGNDDENGVQEFPGVTRKQREAIAEWRVRFRSFRSGSIELARELATSREGRKTLQGALDGFVHDFEDAKYFDDEEVSFFAEQISKCWPESEAAPMIASGEGRIAREVSSMIREAFSIRANEHNQSTAIAKAG